MTFDLELRIVCSVLSVDILLFMLLMLTPLGGLGWQKNKRQQIIFVRPWIWRFCFFVLSLSMAAQFLLLWHWPLLWLYIIVSPACILPGLYLSGPQEVVIDLYERKIRIKRGWPLFSKRWSSSLESIVGIEIVKYRRDDAAKLMLCLQPGQYKKDRLQIGQYSNDQTATKIAEKIASQLGVSFLGMRPRV